MGYRHHDHKHKHKHGKHEIHDTASAGHIYVTNGNHNSIAIPCWYYPIPIKHHDGPHCRAEHDHLGWPSPDHPDQICQDSEFFGYPIQGFIPNHAPLQIVDVKTVPIHLTDEGYTSISCAVDDLCPDGVDIEGTIDEIDDWIIRVTFDVEAEAAIDEPVDFHLAVRACKGTAHRDTVGVFKVTILPAPLFTA